MTFEKFEARRQECSEEDVRRALANVHSLDSAIVLVIRNDFEVWNSGVAAGMMWCCAQIRSMFASVPADIRENICAALTTLSPDPHYVERERLKARLEQAELWHVLLGDDPKTFTWRGQDIAELKSQLAALDKPEVECQACKLSCCTVHLAT